MSVSGLTLPTRSEADARAARTAIVSDEDFVRLALMRSGPNSAAALRRFDRLMMGTET